jgi:hypothetical protein
LAQKEGWKTLNEPGGALRSRGRSTSRVGAGRLGPASRTPGRGPRAKRPPKRTSPARPRQVRGTGRTHPEPRWSWIPLAAGPVPSGVCRGERPMEGPSGMPRPVGGLMPGPPASVTPGSEERKSRTARGWVNGWDWVRSDARRNRDDRPKRPGGTGQRPRTRSPRTARNSRESVQKRGAGGFGARGRAGRAGRAVGKQCGAGGVVAWASIGGRAWSIPHRPGAASARPRARRALWWAGR